MTTISNLMSAFDPWERSAELSTSDLVTLMAGYPQRSNCLWDFMLIIAADPRSRIDCTMVSGDLGRYDDVLHAQYRKAIWRRMRTQSPFHFLVPASHNLDRYVPIRCGVPVSC